MRLRSARTDATLLVHENLASRPLCKSGRNISSIHACGSWLLIDLLCTSPLLSWNVLGGIPSILQYHRFISISVNTAEFFSKKMLLEPKFIAENFQITRPFKSFIKTPQCLNNDRLNLHIFQHINVQLLNILCVEMLEHRTCGQQNIMCPNLFV